MRQPLFRAEAITKHRNHLSGDGVVAVPVVWQGIGCLIFGGVAVGVLFLSLASYSRVETVTGTITPDAGVAAIVPTRAGVIAALAVRDGQAVAAGAEMPPRAFSSNFTLTEAWEGFIGDGSRA